MLSLIKLDLKFINSISDINSKEMCTSEAEKNYSCVLNLDLEF